MSSLGESPAVLAKRKVIKTSNWCPKTTPTDDLWCDPEDPKIISYKDTVKATSIIKEHIKETPLNRSKCCVQFDMELYYKFETVHHTGSFHERAAVYSLSMLNDEERAAGVITASLGNWAMALSYYGKYFNIPVTVILPVHVKNNVIVRCQNHGACVIQYGKDLCDAMRYALLVKTDMDDPTYLNGYDHPHVIAAAGSIGFEILEQLPHTDVIIVPIGGGGLIAGLATVVKKLKPNVKIYGVEPKKCCSFFKALENENPYQTVVENGVAEQLEVPKAGCNAFNTARSLIDKMVLVDDDWICKAILHLTEEEKFVVEGAGAASLSPLFATPAVIPELRGKTVVCVVSGGNTDYYTLKRNIERAKAVEGRLVKLMFTLRGDSFAYQKLRVLRVIANIGCNIVTYETENALDEEFGKINLTLGCETEGFKHACNLKRVMDKLFPNCKFLEGPFNAITSCVCYPNPMLF